MKEPLISTACHCLCLSPTQDCDPWRSELLAHSRASWIYSAGSEEGRSVWLTTFPGGQREWQPQGQAFSLLLSSGSPGHRPGNSRICVSPSKQDLLCKYIIRKSFTAKPPKAHEAEKIGLFMTDRLSLVPFALFFCLFFPHVLLILLIST